MRLISFETGPVTVELQVTERGAVRDLVAQVTGTALVGAEVETSAGRRDIPIEDSLFTVEGVPAGLLRLRLPHARRPRPRHQLGPRLTPPPSPGGRNPQASTTSSRQRAHRRRTIRSRTSEQRPAGLARTWPAGAGTLRPESHPCTHAAEPGAPTGRRRGVGRVRGCARSEAGRIPVDPARGSLPLALRVVRGIGFPPSGCGSARHRLSAGGLRSPAEGSGPAWGWSCGCSFSSSCIRPRSGPAGRRTQPRGCGCAGGTGTQGHESSS